MQDVTTGGAIAGDDGAPPSHQDGAVAPLALEPVRPSPEGVMINSVGEFMTVPLRPVPLGGVDAAPVAT